MIGMIGMYDEVVKMFQRHLFRTDMNTKKPYIIVVNNS
jgi:hypothetical protein